MTGQLHENQAPSTRVPERSLSLAHRMLCGAGRASLVAYGLPGQPSLHAVAHGLTVTGDLVVAASVLPGSPSAVFESAGVLNVRLDITKLSPDPRVQIVAATAHMLGCLEWLDPSVTAARVAAGGLPGLVAAVADSPAGRLGIIHITRVLLHDGAGVTPIPADTVMARHRGAGRQEAEDVESAGLDIAVGLDTADLASLGDAVARGWVSAQILSRRPAAGLADAVNREFMVDADLTGLTLMCVADHQASVFFVPFEHKAATARELPAHVGTLLGAPVGAVDL